MRTIASWGLGLLLAACGSSSGGADLAQGDVPPTDRQEAVTADLADLDPGAGPKDGSGPATCTPAPFAGSLLGTWAQVQTREALVDSEALTDVRRLYTSLYLWTVTGEDPDWTVVSTVCQVEVESPESPVQTRIPEALVRSIDRQHLPVVFEAEAGGWRLRQDRAFDVRGASLVPPWPIP